MKPAAALTLAIALAACAGPAGAPRPGGAPAPPDATSAREILLRFGEALEAGRFEVAWALLSPRWRATTTPARLASDWRGAAGIAGDAAARARLRGATAPLTLESGPPAVARLDLGEGRQAVLVAEGSRWRVDRLE